MPDNYCAFMLMPKNSVTTKLLFIVLFKKEAKQKLGVVCEFNV